MPQFGGAEIGRVASHFQCWKEKIPQADDESRQIAHDLLQGKVADKTHGATHFHTVTQSPAWSKGKTPCATVGHLVFYKETDAVIAGV